MVILFFIVGACVGSFACVFVERSQKNKKFILTRSRCECCETIPFYLNIPILAYILLKGKTKCCNQKIPKLYFIIEVMTACIFCAIKFKYTTEIACGLCLLSLILIIISLIDFDTMTIPDKLSIGCALLGIITSFFVPSMQHKSYMIEGLLSSIMGIFIASGLLFWISEVSSFILKKETLGLGDIKLIGAIGSFIGWLGAIKAIMYGSIIGLFIIAIMFFMNNCVIKRNMRVPFAPLLTIGVLYYLGYG